MASEVQNLQSAVWILAGAFVLCFAGILRFAPGWINKQINLRQTKESQALQQEKQRADNEAANAQAERAKSEEDRKAFHKMVDTLSESIKRRDGSQEELVKGFTRSVDTLDSMSKELRANTTVTKGGVEAISDLKDSIDSLLDSGSKPLQGAVEKLNELANEVSNIRTDLQTDRQKTLELQQRLEALLTEGNQLYSSIQVIISVADAKLREVKQATSEVVAVNVPVNPTPA